jgi:nucleoside-diphosphate-sugar epimerase
MSKETVLLTGATGFLGSHLLEALLKHRYKVVILKRSTSDTWRIKHLLDQIESYDVDVVELERAFEEHKIDIVIHLATLYRKFEESTDIEEMVVNNISFPTRLLYCAMRHEVKGFINTGTFFEYDCSKLPVDENASPKPFNFYAQTKLAFENILKSHAEKVPSITLKLFSPYGEKDNQKLIPALIQNILADNEMQLSDGLQKLDFTYAADIVDAYLKACEKVLKTKTGFSTYNIGSGVATSIREIVSILEQQLNRSIKKCWGAPSRVDIPIAIADTTKAQAELGWEPTWTIHQGLQNTYQYYANAERF